MFNAKWKSVEEIDKAYSDHIESVEMSGVEFDKAGILKEWAASLKNFAESPATSEQPLLRFRLRLR